VESRAPKEVIEELMRWSAARDFAVIDELIAEDMVNHAAAVKTTRAVREADRVGSALSRSHDNCRRHVASTMPVLAGTEITQARVGWTYIHI
jgi:hypothetical protein